MPTATAQQISDATFFSANDAARLARLRPSTLRYWQSVGIVVPSQKVLSPENLEIDAGFTLEDVGYLHLLRHLRSCTVPMEEAISVLSHLTKRYGPPSERWREASMAIVPHPNRRGRHQVIAKVSDEWGATVAVPGLEGAGQRAWEELLAVLPEQHVSLESILIPSRFLPSVSIDPDICNGHPVVRGSTIRTSTVRAILDTVSESEFRRDFYPHLQIQDVRLAKRFEEELDRAA